MKFYTFEQEVKILKAVANCHNAHTEVPQWLKEAMEHIHNKQFYHQRVRLQDELSELKQELDPVSTLDMNIGKLNLKEHMSQELEYFRDVEPEHYEAVKAFFDKVLVWMEQE